MALTGSVLDDIRHGAVGVVAMKLVMVMVRSCEGDDTKKYKERGKNGARRRLK
jgi:hypothetical protein